MASDRGSAASPLSGLPTVNQATSADQTSRTLLEFKSNLEILAAQQAALLRLTAFGQTGFMSNLVAQSHAARDLQALQNKEKTTSPPVTPPNSTPSASTPTTPATSAPALVLPNTNSETSTSVSNISPLSSATHLPGQPGPFPPGIQNIKDLLFLQQQQQLQAQHLQQLQQLQQVVIKRSKSSSKTLFQTQNLTQQIQLQAAVAQQQPSATLTPEASPSRGLVGMNPLLMRNPYPTPGE